MNFLLVLLLVPLFFFLLGYLFARIFIHIPETLSAGQRWFLPVVASICLTTWVGLTLAEFGAFSLLNVTAIVALVCAASAIVARRRLVRWSLRGFKPDWIFFATFALAVFLFARPAEYIIGNSDAGTYVNVGANLARTGAIAIHDAQVAQLPFDSAKAFYWQLVNPFMLYKAVRLPGFFIADPAQGLVLPQFLHLYPVWLALWDSLVGVQWGLYATPVIALLGSVAFYFLARSLYESFRAEQEISENKENAAARNFARLAFFLLVITVPQFWFARYPVAEAMTQFLVLTGMWVLFKMEKNRDRSLGLPLLAGIAFGEIFLTRADAILLLAPLGIYALALIFLRRWRREHWALFGAFGVLFTQAVVHILVFAPNYFYFQYSHALRMKNIDKLLPGGLPQAEALFGDARYALLLLGVLALAIGVLFLVDRAVQRLRARWGREFHAAWRRAERPLRILGAGAVLVLFGLAYFVWARPESAYAYVGGATPPDPSANLVKLGWYLSPIGIALAAFGAALVIRRDLNARNAFFFGTAALFAVTYLEELYSNPHYIYTTRHYIPLVIPLFILLATRALVWLWNYGAQHTVSRRVGQLARAAAVGAFAIWMLYNLYAMGIVDASRANGVALRMPFVRETTALGVLKIEPLENSIAGTNELGGAYQQIEALANQLDPNAVIIFSAGRDEPAALATPLKFVFGRDAFVSVFNNPPGDKVAALIDHWRAQGRDVILAYGTNGGKLQIPNYALERIGEVSLDVPQWAFAYDFMPRSTWRVNLNYALFRVVPRTGPDAYPFVLDFGGNDFPHLVSGFLERSPKAGSRWIGAIVTDANKAREIKSLSGVVRVPVGDGVSDLKLTLRARAPRDKVRLHIKSGENVLGSVRLTETFNAYTVNVSRAELKQKGDDYWIELVSQATPDGQGRILGAELESLIAASQP